MAIYKGIGVMTGTSLDGIDLVYAAFEESGAGWSYEILQSEEVAMPQNWYARLRCLDTASALAYARTHVYFGHLLGEVTAGFIKRHELEPQFVAAHGQTIFHQPKRNFTAQIGDGESMVTYLECPLVTNFRNKDLALAGEGAPLVPFGERFLFPKHSLFMNIGGIANLGIHPKGKDPVAFDLAFANMALNWLTRSLETPMPYDPQGQLAAGGTLLPGVFAELEALDYLHQRPRPSLGTELFESQVLPIFMREDLDRADLLHTYTAHFVARTAEALAETAVPGQSLFVTGGGAHNSYLMAQLAAAIQPHGFTIAEVDRQTIDSKEALIFAFMGLQTLLGRNNVLRAVTGSHYDHVAGSIHVPSRNPKPYL